MSTRVVATLSLAAAFCAALSATTVPAFALTPAPNDAQAQKLHAQGSCGTLGPGSGLSANGKGWVVSMMPGPHEFRVRGAGTVYVTVARQTKVDFDIGRPYYIVVEGAKPDSVLEWKIPGSDWGPISKYFLYPVSKT
jgi:hypothetical protein